MSRSLRGTAAALATLAVCTGVMLPLRGQLREATTTLVLMVPVVVGVALGAFVAGAVSAVAGFLVYDFFFIPPYRTLAVRSPQEWVVLGVYVVVMLLVARVVSTKDAARAQAGRQGRELRQLFELSDLLLADKPLEALLAAVTSTLAEVFGCEQVAVLAPRDGRLQVVASAGRPLSPRQRHRLLPAGGQPATLDASPAEREGLLVLALAAAGGPVGLLALSAEPAARHEREPLLLFANHIALAVERAQLRDQVVQTRLAEGMARLARTLVGAVSHDLRAPLASIKASSSTLADPDLHLDPAAARHLARLVDVQADRLAALVQSLLDMSRIQAGVLQPRTVVTSLPDLIADVVADMTEVGGGGHPVRVEVAPDLPPVEADVVLVSRVLTNLLQNAFRYSPAGATVQVQVRPRSTGQVEVSVTDRGPGVGPDRRGEIFEVWARRPDDTGAGLGLAIARTFVEAHGQRIWVEDAPGGGARFVFTLAVAAVPEEPSVATRTGH